MATRIVEGKKPYTGGKAISIDENKVISLNLRDENNLIIYDAGDDEIYVDLQLDDEITPTSAFPIGVNVGRVIVDNGWDKPGTIISAETTSGDNIKIFYADEGTLWIDNGTGTFKQIYFKSDVDALLLALRNYIDGELAKKQNGVSSDTAPSNPSEGDLWYDTTNSAMKVWDGTAWQSVGTGGGGSDIVYATQAEYNALPSSKLTDNKHYFIYISDGGGGGWQPGVNTLVYLPFTEDLLDHSGNGVTFTQGGTNLSIVNGVADFDGGYLYKNASYGLSSLPATVSLWFYTRSLALTGETSIINSHIYIGNFEGRGCILNNNRQVILECLPGSPVSTNSIDFNKWYYLTFVLKSSGSDLYLNGQKIGTTNSGLTLKDRLAIGTAGWITSDFGNHLFDGQMSQVIIEDKERIAQEITDYYDQTKSLYGIS